MANKKILAAGVLSLLGVLFFGAFYASAYSPGNGFYATDNQAVKERNAERQLMHEQMESIIENGTYADLVAFKEENNLNFMPWVTDEETFQQLKERHETMEAYRAENGIENLGMGMRGMKSMNKAENSGMGIGMQHSGMGKGMNSEMGPKMGQGMKAGKGYGTGPHDGTGTGPNSVNCPLNA